MRSAVRLVHYFAAIYAPVGLATLLLPSLLPQGKFGQDFAVTALGLLLLAWIIATLVTIVRLMIDRAFREAVITAVIGLRERDEREEMIVGGAARASFFTTVATTFALLFLSIFNYVDYHNPQDEGFGLVVEPSKLGLLNSAQTNDWATTYPILPLTTPALLLALLTVQVSSFALFSWMKRESAS